MEKIEMNSVQKTATSAGLGRHISGPAAAIIMAAAAARILEHERRFHEMRAGARDHSEKIAALDAAFETFEAIRQPSS